MRPFYDIDFDEITDRCRPGRDTLKPARRFAGAKFWLVVFAVAVLVAGVSLH